MSQQSLMGLNSSDVKLRNISAILLTLLLKKSISRVNLAQELGVSPATITNLVNELKQMGLVSDDLTTKNETQVHVGRPQRPLQLVPFARYAVGVHINVGIVHIILTDSLCNEVASLTFTHEIEQVWDVVLDQISQHIDDLITQHKIDQALIIGVGVAASGLVDTYTGINHIAPNLNWHDVPIKDYLHERLNLPIAVDNNVRAMALGEALFGLAKSVYAVAFVYARIGVGAGLLVGNEPYRGASAGAGEIGHTTLLVQDGDSFTTQCLEDLFSEPIIVQSAQVIAQNHPNSIVAKCFNECGVNLGTIFQSARDGDELIQDMLDECVSYMGIALANLVNIFNPELIVLGGIFLKGEDVLLPKLEATLREYSFATLGDNIEIQTTRFGNQAGMIGATALALDRFFYRPTK